MHEENVCVKQMDKQTINEEIQNEQINTELAVNSEQTDSENIINVVQNVSVIQDDKSQIEEVINEEIESVQINTKLAANAEQIDNENIINIEQKQMDNEAYRDEKPMDEQNDKLDDDKEEDEDVIDIDVVMNEIIEKSATQKIINNSDISPRTPLKSDSDNGSGISTAMSSVEYQFKLDWRIGFRPYYIKREWTKLIPNTTDSTHEHFTCGVYINKCPCIKRLIFILNNYMLFIKYKISSSMKKKKYLNRDYPKKK
eukprot:415783_1